ncbi:protein of unknown function DUF4050, partial [Dillenia turbinata]
ALFSGCVGCFSRTTLSTSLNEPIKEHTNPGHPVTKPGASDNFWTTSTCDMDNSAVQSQGSISSTSVSYQTLDPHGGAGSVSNLSEFVNHGLLLWNKTRRQWIGAKRTENRSQQLREAKLSHLCSCFVKPLSLCSWNATYESLLGSNKPFPQAIPLGEMIDFLVNNWEQEGMYD